MLVTFQDSLVAALKLPLLRLKTPPEAPMHCEIVDWLLPGQSRESRMLVLLRVKSKRKPGNFVGLSSLHALQRGAFDLLLRADHCSDTTIQRSPISRKRIIGYMKLVSQSMQY